MSGPFSYSARLYCLNTKLKDRIRQQIVGLLVKVTGSSRFEPGKFHTGLVLALLMTEP